MAALPNASAMDLTASEGDPRGRSDEPPVLKLPEPIEVPYHTDYAGCHSWVPLKQELLLNGTPVLSDAEFEAKRQQVLKVVS